MIEEFKYQKEMDKQRNNDLEKFEKKKQQDTMKNLDAATRIRIREQEMWTKKHLMI